MYFKGNLIRMFLFPLHLTHKNGLSGQFDVPKIFGAFIMIFFNLSPPSLRHRKLHFLKENESNWKSQGQCWWVRYTISWNWAFGNMVSSTAAPAGLRGWERDQFHMQADGSNWQCVVTESSNSWWFAHQAENPSPIRTSVLRDLLPRIWFPLPRSHPEASVTNSCTEVI